MFCLLCVSDGCFPPADSLPLCLIEGQSFFSSPLTPCPSFSPRVKGPLSGQPLAVLRGAKFLVALC